MDKLWVTIYRDDDEAFDIWHKQVGVAAERIVRLGEKDNFWSMGDTGPCGPCSEIHIDQGPALGTGPEDVLGGSGDRFLELWNLVFMQYNRAADGTLTPLPQQNIDTGMGLERMTAIMQGVQSNYDTDLLRPIIAAVEELAEKPYGSVKPDDVSMRVIADHMRASVFLLVRWGAAGEHRAWLCVASDHTARRPARQDARVRGALPVSPGGHRAARHGQAYPELEAQSEYVSKMLLGEEERFLHTLHQGMRELDGLIDATPRGRHAAYYRGRGVSALRHIWVSD